MILIQEKPTFKGQKRKPALFLSLQWKSFSLSTCDFLHPALLTLIQRYRIRILFLAWAYHLRLLTLSLSVLGLWLPVESRNPAGTLRRNKTLDLGRTKNIEMDGSCQKTDASIVSRSSEPFIQIDSITIDLISSDDKIDCGQCEHFSIRQFVSKTRKKDWKMCWPFPLDGDQESGDQKSFLPPLEIPNFSWWRCPNCQHEISSKDFHPVSKLGTMEKRSINICNPTTLNEYHNPSYPGVRAKKAEVGGNVIGSGDDGKMEMHRFSSLAPKIISSVVLERCINNSVAPKPESNGSRESCQSGHGSRKVGAVELSVANLKVNGKNHVGNFQTGKHISTDDECRLLCQASEICRVVDNGCNSTVMDRSKSDPSIEANKRIVSASEFPEISVGNNIPDGHVHKSSGSLRRKSPKLRLLTELLGENRSMKNKLAGTTNSPSNGTPDASTMIDTVYVPPSQVVVRGSNGEGPCQSRKRSLIQDEEWGPQEISSGNENKNVKALKKDVKTNEFSIGYKPEDPFGRTGLKTIKSRFSKNRLNRDHMLDRKKYNKPKVLDPGFPLMQPRENVLQEIQEKHASVYSWMDSFPFTGERQDSILSHVKGNESKSSLCAKKGNMQFKEVVETPFFWDNDLLRPGSTAREDVETMRYRSVATPFQSRKDEFSDRGLDLSLSSYMAAQRLDTNCVPQGGDRLPSFQPHQGSTSGLSQFSRKEIENKTPLDLSPHFISSDALVTQGVQGELNKKVSTYRIPFPVERQQLTPQCEDSVCSHLQRMAIAGPSSCMKNTEDRECLAIKKKQKDKRVDNAYADDIPMEIVELMAKNQFERELYDAEKKKHLPETENSTRRTPMAYNGNSFSNESSRFLQMQENQKPKPQARNKNNSVIAAKEVVGPKKQSPVDNLSYISGCHFNPNHLQQTQSSEGYGATIQSQMKTPREIQYSTAGSSKIGKPLHGKYWGTVEDPRSSYSRVHAFEGCREHLSVSLQNEDRARICSQMMLNPSSFGCNTHQKGSEKSKNADKFSNGHSSTDKTNFSAYSLQALGRTNAECPYSYQSTGVEIHQKPMNSLDLCSNETIPAMHLLSLMDAGMQSSPSGTSKFPKKSPFSLNLKSDEFSRCDIVSNKMIENVRFPLSDYYSRAHLSEKSIDRFPAGAAPCKSTSFQQARRFVRASNFSDKFTSKSTKKETTNRSAVSPWKSSQKSQKCVVTSDGMDNDNNGALSFIDPADSALFTVGCQKNRRVSQHILEDRGSNAMLPTSKRTMDTGVCTVNKNPSDFSLPEAGNIYTIGADDLKFGQNMSSAIQSCSIVLDGRKKRRNAKHNIVNEYGRHLIQR